MPRTKMVLPEGNIRAQARHHRRKRLHPLRHAPNGTLGPNYGLHILRSLDRPELRLAQLPRLGGVMPAIVFRSLSFVPVGLPQFVLRHWTERPLLGMRH